MGKKKRNRKDQTVFHDAADVVNVAAQAFFSELSDVMRQNVEYSVNLAATFAAESFKYLLEAAGDKEELKKRMKNLKGMQSEMLKLFMKLK